MKENISKQNLSVELDVTKKVSTSADKSGQTTDGLENEQKLEDIVLGGLKEQKEEKLSLEALCALIDSTFGQVVEQSFWGLDPNIKEVILEKGKEYSLEQKLQFLVATTSSQEEFRKIIIDDCREKYKKAVDGWKQANEITQQGIEIIKKLTKENKELDSLATKMTSKAYELYQTCNKLESKLYDAEKKCCKYEGESETYKRMYEGILDKVLQNKSITSNETPHSDENQHVPKAKKELSPYNKLLKMITATKPKNLVLVTNSLKKLRENNSLENKIQGESLVTITCEMIGVLKELDFYDTNLQNVDLADMIMPHIESKQSRNTIATYIGKGKSSTRKIVNIFRAELQNPQNMRDN